MYINIPKKITTCPSCGSVLRIDDCDQDDRYNKTNYLVCDTCGLTGTQRMVNGSYLPFEIDKEDE